MRWKFLKSGRRKKVKKILGLSAAGYLSALVRLTAASCCAGFPLLSRSFWTKLNINLNERYFKTKFIWKIVFCFQFNIWCVLLLGKTLDEGRAITSIGISHSLLFWTVTSILLLHIIFNKYVTWIFCFVVFNLLLLTHILKLIEDYKSIHGTEKIIWMTFHPISLLL